MQLICMCSCVQVHVCAPVYGTRGCPQEPAALFIETGHLIDLGFTDCAQLAGQQAPRILSLQLPDTEIQACATMTTLLFF